MRRTILLASLPLVLGFVTACQPSKPEVRAEKPTGSYRPEKDLGRLFHDVQMAGVFPDSKTFADCDPLQSAEAIVAAYAVQKRKPDFNLADFVRAHFRVPQPRGGAYVPDSTKSFETILTKKWDYLTRAPDEQGYGSLIPLPHKYVVPGGRFGEIYYWDSYFTMLGLQVSGRQDLMENMLDNFAYLIDSIGFIPNGNRTYFLSRSQPPFFAAMVNLLAESQEDAYVLKYLPALEQEYAFWMDGATELTPQKPAYRRVVQVADKQVLNRYFDDNPAPRPESYKEDVQLAAGLDAAQQKALFTNLRAACESGWDFSTRWFKQANSLKSIITTEILPVDLNCLMYNLEATIARLNQVAGNTQQATVFSQRAAARKALILEVFWNADKGYFVDYHWPSSTPRTAITPAGMYPFYFKLAESKQAALAAGVVRNNLLKSGGVLTTAYESGQQWDAPNGWAPLQWMTIEGFRRYGNDRLSDEISKSWLALNQRVFDKTGKMMEKYNVLDITLDAGGGEYPTQDGFGWSNGVVLRLLNNPKK